ncbi:hypothetical protein [Leptolyngbya sp. AN10]|uniref:hypothetical protein n=1 Tax=Leptolyngbya sp. AN10 TaxID=3423365 RepID=UPI003D3212A4
MMRLTRTALSEEVKPALEQTYKIILQESQSLFSKGTRIEIRRNLQTGIPQIAFNLCAIRIEEQTIILESWLCQCWIETLEDKTQRITSQIHHSSRISVNLATQVIEYKCGEAITQISPTEIAITGNDWDGQSFNSEWDALSLINSCLLALQLNSCQSHEIHQWDGKSDPSQLAKTLLDPRPDTRLISEQVSK